MLVLGTFAQGSRARASGDEHCVRRALGAINVGAGSGVYGGFDVRELSDLTMFGHSEIKWMVFKSDGQSKVLFFDPRQYRFHDEWHWLSEVNEGREPASRFKSPAEAYQYFYQQGRIPPGLVDQKGRIVSPEFYAWATDSHAKFTLGSVVLLDQRQMSAARLDNPWTLRIEYRDILTQEELESVWKTVADGLSWAGPKLSWVPRGKAQDDLAQALLASGKKIRVVSEARLNAAASPGIYTSAIAVGRVKIVKAADLSHTTLSPDDIVVLEQVPTDLPPVAGIISASPQTPLSHLALLAASRRTPNAYVPKAGDLPHLKKLAETREPVILSTVDDQTRWHSISEAEFEKHARNGRSSPTIAPVRGPLEPDRPISGLQAFMSDLDAAVLASGGGKTLGLADLAREGLLDPQDYLVIPVDGMRGHLSTHAQEIESALADPRFLGDPRIRRLVLEGPESYRKAYAQDPGSLALADRILADSSDRSPLTGLLRAGGIMKLVRESPLPPEYERLLASSVKRQFGDLGPNRELLVRSSARSEDVRGFNAAGLYESVPAKPSDVGSALREVWASYWSFKAFEERRMAGVPTTVSDMAAVITPRIPADRIEANAVASIELTLPSGYKISINARRGSGGVVEGKGAPEVLSFSGAKVEVVSTSDHPGGLYRRVIDDTEVAQIRDRLVVLATKALKSRNQGLAEELREKTIRIETEIIKTKRPAPGEAPALHYVQKRPLESRVQASPEIAPYRIPDDILRQATAIKRRRLDAPAQAMSFEVVEVATVESFNDSPFTAYVKVTFNRAVAGFSPGQSLVLYGSDLGSVSHPFYHHGEGYWDFYANLSMAAQQRLGIARVSADFSGVKVTLADGSTVATSGEPVLDFVAGTPELRLRDVIRTRKANEQKH